VVKLSVRVRLIVLAVAAATLFVGAVAWRESGLPLAYLGPERVHAGRATGLPGRRGRDLERAEIAELCTLLRRARRIDDFEGPRSVSVELATLDYGRVLVHDFAGPGANLHLDAGGPNEAMVSVRSRALGELLGRLGRELARPAEKAAAP